MIENERAKGEPTTDRLDEVLRNRIRALLGEFTTLVAADALDPQLPHDLRTLATSVHTLASVVSKMQTAHGSLGSFDAHPKPETTHADRTVELEPGVSLYDGFIARSLLPSYETDEESSDQPEPTVVEIIDNFTLRCNGEQVRLAGNGLYCFNAFALNHGRWISARGARGYGFDMMYGRVHKQALSTETAVFARALLRLESTFSELTGQPVVVRRGNRTTTLYQFNPTIALVDLRAAEVELPADDIENVRAPEPATAPAVDVIPDVPAETTVDLQNTASAIAAFINTHYEGLAVDENDVMHTAYADRRIEFQSSPGGLIFSHYAAERIIKAIVERAGYDYVEPD